MRDSIHRHIFKRASFCTGLSVLALGLLAAAPSRAQGNLPPPPPPLGTFPPAPPAGPPSAETQPNASQPLPIAAEPILITVDAAAKRHDISPLIYSVSSAAPAQLKALNAPLVSQQVGPGLLNFRVVQSSLPSRVFSDDTSPDTQALRSRSTRLLWDPRYGSPQGAVANSGSSALIPSLKRRLSAYPPGAKAGLINYSWGAENSIGGATAQADVLGIFGREGLNVATRAAPETSSPTFKAMQMYRNYDGKNSAFGSVSVSDSVPNPDTLSSFASVRRSDGALTVMVVNKSLTQTTPITLSVFHFAGTVVNAWQLTSANAITKLPPAVLRGSLLSATLPAQSITLFVVAAR